MVASVTSGVNNAAAYLKSSQLAGGQNPSARAPDERESQANRVQQARTAESASTQRSTDDKNSLFRAAETTQLSARNDNSVVENEQQRGSLLDISV